MTERLVPFLCIRCGAPLAAIDADTTACPACGTGQPVPPSHRAAVRMMRASDASVRRAAELLAHFESRRIPWSVLLAISLLPTAILVIGLGAGLVVEFGVVPLDVGVPELVGFSVWLPLVGAAVLVTLVYWYAAWSSAWIAGARQALAATRTSRGGLPACRQCGAPLSLESGAAVARCIYCGADSLVALDAPLAREHAKRIEAADANAERAIAEFQARARKASRSSFAIGAVWLGLSILPALWSFGGRTFRGDIWSALIGFDVGVLTLYSTAMTVGTLATRRPGASGDTARTGWFLPAWLAALGMFIALALRECAS